MSFLLEIKTYVVPKYGLGHCTMNTAEFYLMLSLFLY